MTNDKGRRCRYCGGTLWLDGDTVKCLMCSRPGAGSAVPSWMPLTNVRTPKLPGPFGKSEYRNTK
jgi:hypothetical protein